MEFKFFMLLLAFQMIVITFTSSEKESIDYKCVSDSFQIVNHMVSGIDIIKFNIRDGHALYRRHTVMSLSCKSNRTWSNDQVLPNQKFALPDQIAQISVNVSNDLYVPKVQFAHNILEMRDILLSMKTIPDNLAGACSGNKAYRAYLQEYFQLKATFVLMTSQIDVYNVELKPPRELLLDSSFMDLMKTLPAKYEQDPKEYLEFVFEYGTHYIERAKFGGMILWKFLILNSYYRDTSDEEIEDNLKALFFMWLGQNVTKPKGLKNFCKNVDNCNLYSRTVFGAIDDSHHAKVRYLKPGYVYSNPHIIEYTLRPMADLIAQVEVDENLKAQIKIAIEIRQIESYLDELKDVYNTAKEYYNPSVEDQDLLRMVEHFVYYNISSLSAEEAIQIIDYLYSKVEASRNIENQKINQEMEQIMDRKIADYYVTAALKLQLAQSICSTRSEGLCPSKIIKDENEQLEQLNREYELSKADGKDFTREIYLKFKKRAQELNDKYQIEAEMQKGLTASCEKC